MTKSLPATFYPSRWKTVLMLFVGGVFVAVAVLMVTEPPWIRFPSIAFFSLIVVVAVVQLLPGASFLKVDADGFEFSTLFRRTQLAWSDVSEFGVITMTFNGIPTKKMVGFNFSPRCKKAKIGRAIAKGLAEFEGALPDTYGWKAEKLAFFLSEIHEKRKASNQSLQTTPILV